MYVISSSGYVRNTKTGRILKPGKTGGGYFAVNLFNRGVREGSVKIHRLVAEYYLQKVEGKKCVNHKDGNKENNNVENLEWCTYSENTKHAYDTGLLKPCHKLRGVPKYHLRGSLSQNAKINENDVLKIRSSNLQRSELAKQYNLSWTSINAIIKRKSWAHIK